MDQSINKEIADEACSLPWIECQFWKCQTTLKSISLREALIYMLNSHSLRWSRNLCKVYIHSSASEKVSCLVVMAAAFNSAKNNIYLTLPCQCEIHIMAIGNFYWAYIKIRATISYLVSSKAKDRNSLMDGPASSPQDTFLWGSVDTCRLGIILRHLLMLPGLNSVLSGCQANLHFQWV